MFNFLKRKIRFFFLLSCSLTALLGLIFSACANSLPAMIFNSVVLIIDVWFTIRELK